MHWNSQTELHELHEKVKWYESAEKKQGAQSQPASVEGRREEDGKMEVDEEVDSKKKLRQQKKKTCKNSCETSEKFTDVPPDIQHVLEETWQQELQHIGQLRNDLLAGSINKCRKGRAFCRAYRKKKAAVSEGFGNMGKRS